MSRSSRYFFVAIALLLSATLTVSVHAKKKGGGGKPGGGDPPPPTLAPFRYQIQFFDAGNINDANDWGDAVGWHSVSGVRYAWLYSSIGNQVFYLNEIGIVMPEGYAGFSITSAVGINNKGDIVGYIRPIGENYGLERYGFVLDMDVEPPQLTVIRDDELLGSNSYARRINENGDVLGKSSPDDNGFFGNYFYNSGKYGSAYDPIDPGLSLKTTEANLTNDLVPVAAGLLSDGTLVRFSPFGVIDSYPTSESSDFSVWDMNQHGVMCGVEVATVQIRKNRTSTEYIPFRFGSSVESLPSPTGESTAFGINDDGDFVTQAHLFHDDWGYLSIDAHIDLNDADAEEWFSSTSLYAKEITNRLEPLGFPGLVGTIQFADGARHFVLTPVPAP